MKIAFTEKYLSSEGLNRTLAAAALAFFNKYCDEMPENFALAQQFVTQNNTTSRSKVDCDLGLPIIRHTDITIDETGVVAKNYSVYGHFIYFIDCIKRIVVDGYTSEYPGLRKMDVPPLEVFQKIGHSKLGIIEDPRAQAALYD